MQVYWDKLGSEGSNLPQEIEVRRGVEVLRNLAWSRKDETEFLGWIMGFSLPLSIILEQMQMEVGYDDWEVFI